MKHSRFFLPRTDFRTDLMLGVYMFELKLLIMNYKLHSSCSIVRYNCKRLDIRIIIKIHELIEVELTGSPKDFAEKINVSERTVYNYLEYMKTELQAPIQYNASKKSYCYDGECGLRFRN